MSETVEEADLVADDGFTLIFEKFDKIEYFNGECNRYVDKFVAGFFHSGFSFPDGNR